MKKLLYCIFLLAIACYFSSCSLVNGSPSSTDEAYVKTTATFTNSLLAGNYQASVNLLNLTPKQRSGDLSGLKVGLDSLAAKIGRNFGTNLKYSFMNAQTSASNNGAYNLQPNTTLLAVEFNNGKDIGVLQVLFDNASGKINNIQSLQVRQPIPDMDKFWLVGLLALAVVLINLVAIILALRSKLRLKWLYCVAIVIINVPSIEYGAAGGFSFKILRDQYLLGVNFQKIGYLGAFWEIGIPIAAIFTIISVIISRSKKTTPTTDKKPQPAKGRGSAN